MTPAELRDFMRRYRYAVQASVSPSGAPQAAVVGIVVTDAFELFFDTLATSRKASNLKANAAVAFVIGGTADDDERTVQYEGFVDRPEDDELRRLKEAYFARFPDGRERERDPAIMYLRARPTWVRYSDFSKAPPLIVEFDRDQLRGE